MVKVMNKKIISFFEGLVVVAIILVLVQTFLEDFAVLVGYSWTIRRYLVITGFCFDLFFTLEFLIRFYTAVSLGKVKDYMGRRQGWIDLAASIPLLILNSGPGVLAVLGGSGVLLAGGGALNMLKIIKTIRIARILRLLRVLKIFRQIKNIHSSMAQRHVTRITSLVITGFVGSVFLFSLLGTFLSLPQAGTVFRADAVRKTEQFEGSVNLYGEKTAVESFFSLDDSLLIIKKSGNTILARHDNTYFSANFGMGDYLYIQKGLYSFFFNQKEINRQESIQNLLYFFIVLVLTALLLFVYSPHFAVTISDPVHVMRRGLEEKSYNFEVRIPNNYRNDDIFLLSQSYNQEFLPLKDLQNRREDKAPEDLDLKIENMGDLFN